MRGAEVLFRKVSLRGLLYYLKQYLLRMEKEIKKDEAEIFQTAAKLALVTGRLTQDDFMAIQECLRAKESIELNCRSRHRSDLSCLGVFRKWGRGLQWRWIITFPVRAVLGSCRAVDRRFGEIKIAAFLRAGGSPRSPHFKADGGE
jgi:hypothetical protein